MARLWTGFDDRPTRGNVAHYTGDTTDNTIDPSKINPTWRDVLPKMDLFDGFIGDTYPICADSPSQRFLRKGARYMYLAQTAVSRLQGLAGTVTLSASGSALRALLCDISGGSCRFPSDVVLSSNLACHGIECDVDTMPIVQIIDTAANVTVYYEYVPPACVHMQMYANATQIKGPGDKVMCADPNTAAAGTACDSSGTAANVIGEPECLYPLERVTLATAHARCSNVSKYLNLRHRHVDVDAFCLYNPGTENFNHHR